MPAGKATVKKKTNKGVKKADEIRLSIVSSFNNTVITASDYHSGDVLSWISAGSCGFKGAKKGTPYAATTAMKMFIEKIKSFQPNTIHVFVSGAGNGRDAALRALTGSGLRIADIKDVTSLPHNGSRKKKPRRV